MAVANNLKVEMFKLYCLDEDTFAMFTGEEKLELIRKTILQRTCELPGKV